MCTDQAVRVPIREDADVIAARQHGRAVAERIGMSTSQQTMLATAISEIARNIVAYVGRGEIVVSVVAQDGRRGIEVVAHDEGPGIEDVELAMQDGYSTAGSLGLGLPGARRLTDEFSIASVYGQSTTVVLRTWVRDDR